MKRDQPARNGKPERRRSRRRRRKRQLFKRRPSLVIVADFKRRGEGELGTVPYGLVRKQHHARSVARPHKATKPAGFVGSGEHVTQ
jgi:hypothetical protein